MADELTGTTFEQSTTERGRELLARMDRFPAWPLRKRDFFVIGIAYFFVFMTSAISVSPCQLSTSK
ncbi:hypothetical protein [Corynebacterium parakroppenstedtii]|uniref:hypothetical protein n=1 Tax=Corynebacterium parakroppenstedtii TaxID=2828363 RepID=UPI001C8F4894|nr:hypothetical protein [Corynebacterium parakroppenstedtii]MBY0795697.1 hypothetical protein [Corynebacterium parakroppenstedtii]